MRELLLLLCRYPFEEKNREILSKLLREVQDWHLMVKLINEHGIIALAAYNIREAGLEKEVPDDAMAILNTGYMQNIARNAWLTERWKEVNSILSDAGINHILLKGMALEHTLYGSRGLRQMNDNDIFIKRGDSVKAWKLLEKEGYIPEPFKSPLFEKIKFDFGRHLPALYRDGYSIEIHENLFDSRYTNENDNQALFNDCIETEVAGVKAFTLPDNIHLKYLKKHFEHHRLSGDCQLRLYADLLILDKSITAEFPDRFISDPMQGMKKEFRKPAYKARVHSIPAKHRLLFLLGDTFPSVRWMKERYGCNAFSALLRYPFRVGKLRWLI